MQTDKDPDHCVVAVCIGTFVFPAVIRTGHKHSVAGKRISGLAGSLLKGLHIQSFIVVCDTGKPCKHPRLGSGSVADGGFGGRSIYPPWPYYSLITVNGPGTAVLFQGPVSLTYNRGVASVFPAIVYRKNERRNPPNPSTIDRLRYISAVAPTIPISLRVDEDYTLFWKDIDTYKAESERFQNDLRGRYMKLVEQLRNTGLLSSSEFDSVQTPPVSFAVDDQRSVQTPPL